MSDDETNGTTTRRRVCYSEACRSCGSERLTGQYEGADGMPVEKSHPQARWMIRCGTCGVTM
jgi:hypothetical protein